MSDLVGNPNCWFCHAKAQIKVHHVGHLALLCDLQAIGYFRDSGTKTIEMFHDQITTKVCLRVARGLKTSHYKSTRNIPSSTAKVTRHLNLNNFLSIRSIHQKFDVDAIQPFPNMICERQLSDFFHWPTIA